jgi:hypothetical protein
MLSQKFITLSTLVLVFAVININAAKTNQKNNDDNGQDGGPPGPPPPGVIALMSLCRQYIF